MDVDSFAVHRIKGIDRADVHWLVANPHRGRKKMLG